MLNSDNALPKNLKKNELLALHGVSGWLIIRLQRYAMLGWLAFFLLAIIFGVYIFFTEIRPVPVLAVDESGKLLGKFEYLSQDYRTDHEVISGAKYFVDRYLSVNSSSIYDDYSQALNMMSEELKQEKLRELKETAYLSQVAKAKSRSFLEYRGGEDKPRILWKKEMDYAVSLKGEMVMLVRDQKIERPFDVVLEASIIPRSTLSSHGLKINRIVNN
ncbi:MAG: hypothetical protein ACE5EH_11815 [Gammaproteobacteria bacterium]